MRINISWKYQSRNERTERGNEWKAEWMRRDKWQEIRLHNFFIINFANIRERLWLFKLIEKGCFVSRLPNSSPFRCRLRSNCGSNGPRLTIIYSHRALDQGDEFEFLLIFTFARLLCVVFVVGILIRKFSQGSQRGSDRTQCWQGASLRFVDSERVSSALFATPAKLMARHLSPIRRRRSSPSQQICFIKYSGFVFRRVRQKRGAKRPFMLCP